MVLRIDDILLGKSYLLLNGTTCKIFEIIPRGHSRDEINNRDIICYEAEKWIYDDKRHNGKTRVRIKVREKMQRFDFAKDAARRLD